MIRKNRSIQIIVSGVLLSVVAVLLSFVTIGCGFLLIIAALFGCVFIIYGLTFLPKPKTPFYKAGHILRILMYIGFCCWLISFIIVETLIVHNSKADVYENEKYVLVLGAGVYGEAPSLALSYRLETALDFLNKHTDTTAVLCGSMGPGEKITEAECMRRWLVEHGIAESRLILEDQSHNTIANISNALSLLKQRDGAAPAKIMIVSNDFHVWRAKMIAKRFGVQAGCVPAPTPTVGFTNYSLYLREYFSLLFFLFK